MSAITKVRKMIQDRKSSTSCHPRPRSARRSSSPDFHQRTTGRHIINQAFTTSVNTCLHASKKTNSSPSPSKKATPKLEGTRCEEWIDFADETNDLRVEHFLAYSYLDRIKSRRERHQSLVKDKSQLLVSSNPNSQKSELQISASNASRFRHREQMSAEPKSEGCMKKI